MNKKTKISLITIVITILVVGLLSIISFIIEEKRYEAKKVTPKDEFKIGKMSYQIPVDFTYQKNSYNSDYKGYSYGNGEIFCDIDIKNYKYDEYEVYESGEEYIKKRVYITIADEYETHKDEDWFIIYIKSKEHNNRKVAAIKYKKDIYVIDYQIYDYSHGEKMNTKEYKKCADAYDYIYKSITFEK